MVSVKGFSQAVVAQVVGEFRKAGWNIEAAHGTEDGDVVITIW